MAPPPPTPPATAASPPAPVPNPTHLLEIWNSNATATKEEAAAVAEEKAAKAKQVEAAAGQQRQTLRDAAVVAARARVQDSLALLDDLDGAGSDPELLEAATIANLHA